MLLPRYKMLFWDFDGVIKESVAVKSDAFERLFAPYGPQVAARVREHHERNGGMSRYEKLPIYLEWAGCDVCADEVSRFSERFSAAVRQAVVDCAWVPGAREYLESNHAKQICVLVTASPQREIEDIAAALGIAHWFRELHGSPVAKAVAIRESLGRAGCRSADALLIGDSDADHDAAAQAGVQFLLRRTAFNHELQRAYRGPQCEDFNDDRP